MDKFFEFLIEIIASPDTMNIIPIKVILILFFCAAFIVSIIKGWYLAGFLLIICLIYFIKEIKK